jgi:chemotaxis protein CheD
MSPAPVHRPRMAAALQRLKDSRQGEALAAVGEIVSQLLGCEQYALLEEVDNGARFSPVLTEGLSPALLQALGVPQGIVGQVGHHGVVYVTGRTSANGACPHEQGLTACIPLMHGKQVLGVLALFQRQPQKQGFDDEDLDLLDLLCLQGASALPGGLPKDVPSPLTG